MLKEDILKEVEASDLELLLAKADGLRREHFGDDFDSCSILNAKSGMCSENCAWCSQSRHHKCEGVDIYPLVSSQEAVRHALDNASKGIKRFSLVTSGRALSDAEIDKTYELYHSVRKSSDIYLCASMGLLNEEKLHKLYDAGVRRYHCNIETAPSYFPKLCTTHTIDEKVATIKSAQKVGMEICSGGIIGMGESMDQRVEMALFLKELGVDSVPINVLNPIVGTRLEGAERLSDDELLRTFAMFRLVLPDKHIRFAGGRTLFSGIVKRALKGGISGAIMGDLLTTIGTSVEQDKSMLRELGLNF